MEKQLYSDIYRPTAPAQLIGKDQQLIATQLLDSIKKDKPIKKILFTGPSGVGKTTISEMFVRHLLKLNSKDDIQNYIRVINCTDETGIDNIREVIGQFSYRALGVKYRILFLDELHGLTKQAQGALLTPIEKLPSHVVVIAATTERHKIIETLDSRFYPCELSKPLRADFITMAGWLSKAHNTELTKDIVNEIVDRSNSNVRKYINFLQRVIEGSYTSGTWEDDVDEAIKIILFSNEKNVTKVFKAIQHENDWAGILVRMTRSAITSITKGSKGAYHANCLAILDTFGDGLSSNVDPKTAFHKLLIKYLKVKQ